MAAEQELIKGIRMIGQGNQEGFQILYTHTYNYVYNRAKYIMKNEQDALDLTQETFIQAYKGILKLEDENNVYAWLNGIVYRQGMRIFRKKKELLEDEEAESIFENITAEDTAIQPEAVVDKKETAEIMIKMIEELPELQKEAIIAFYYYNMKIEAIAKKCGCSANTIKSRLNYAKKYLRNRVEQHEKQNGYKLYFIYHN